MSEADSITFDAQVYKVQTLVDGGLRLTLDLPETAISEAAWMMECKRLETPVKVSIKKHQPYRARKPDSTRESRND